MPHDFDINLTNSGTSLNPSSPIAGDSNRDEVAGVTGFFGSRVPGQVDLDGNPDRQLPIKAGVYGYGRGNGVQGESSSRTDSGVWGNNSGGGYGIAGTSDKPDGIGILARGAALAGRFEGDVEVSGDIRMLNADCAEEFDIAADQSVEPGSVVIFGEAGELVPCSAPYDHRAAGIVSGAGAFKPALILDRQQRLGRAPVALIGKVFCKVDATHGAIQTGDLLTTSSTPGHAMRAAGPMIPAGTVIGKALAPCSEGLALIPVFVTHR